MILVLYYYVGGPTVEEVHTDLDLDYEPEEWMSAIIASDHHHMYMNDIM